MPESTLPSSLQELFQKSHKGSVTRIRQRRTKIIYALIFVAGILPMALNLSPEWQAFGLGLWFPGAGFLVSAGWSLLLLPVTLLLLDRKSTRLNSSHVRISYAVFCLKKKKTNQ